MSLAERRTVTSSSSSGDSGLKGYSGFGFADIDLSGVTQKEPLVARLDELALRIVHLAAIIGENNGDETFVTYTSLLIALLQQHTELSDKLAIDKIYAAGRTGAKRVTAWWDGIRGLATEKLEWPTGRPLFSSSARSLITKASMSEEHISSLGLIAAYLDDVPESHRAQMELWGFTPAAIPEIAHTLGIGNRPATSDIQGTTLMATRNLSGFDSAASTILLAGQVLARRRKRPENPPYTAATLLVAMAEVAAFPELKLRELTELRSNLDVANKNSVYSKYRAGAFGPFNGHQDILAEEMQVAPAESLALQLIRKEAQALAELTTGQAVAAPRHLLAAMIVKRDGRHNVDADRLSKERGLNDELLRTQLLAAARVNYQSDNEPAWMRLLEGGRTVATVQADVIPDDPRPDDHLNLRNYADAMAALCSAREQKPPLSIAVFGAWGSGKSFFMRMVRKGIEDCEKLGSTDKTFYSRIVQVEFNAWHYVAGNLWASLMHAILDQLQQTIAPPDKPENFNEYLKRLSIHEAANREAQTRLREAEAQAEAAKSDLESAEAAASAQRVKEAQCLVEAQDVMKGFRAEALAQLAPKGTPDTTQEWVKSVGAKLQEASAFLCLDNVDPTIPTIVAETQTAGTAASVSIGAVEDVLETARASTLRRGALIGWLANARMPRHEIIRLITWVAVIFGVLIAATICLDWAQVRVAAAFTGFASLLCSSGAAITLAASWSKRALGQASVALDWLESLRVRIAAERAQRLHVNNAKLAAAKRETASAVTELQRRQTEYDAARRAVEHARQEAKDATSPERLKRFVAERLATGDYLRHLGLLHTIRKDIDTLAQLLSPKSQAEVLPAGETPVERIILFIDDLDRCPPGRVVEVLEAVHLMLAFPLFVVIVGVDIRWVQQALYERYPKQLGREPGIASAMDYLEKVFQIPFWLPPVEADGGAKLLKAAIGEVEAEVVETDEQDGGTQDLETSTQLHEAKEVPEVDETKKQNMLGGEATRPDGSQDHASSFLSMSEALKLSAAEAKFIGTLSRIVSLSPRRTKRFANLYRLFKGSLSPAKRRYLTYSADSGEAFRSTLFLLAMLTGAPKATSVLIEQLTALPEERIKDGSAQEVLDLLTSISPPAEEASAFKAAKSLVETKVLERNAIENMTDIAREVSRFAFADRS